jgi:hypothetical protein
MEGMNPFYDELKAYCTSGGGELDERDSIGHLYKSINFQRGYGVGYIDPFPHETYGLGFGDTISNLFRMAVPYLKQGLKHLGKKAVDTAANVAYDALEGQNIPEAVKTHVGTTAREIVARAPEVISEVLDKSRGNMDKTSSASENLSVKTTPRRQQRKRRQPIRSRTIKRARKGYPFVDEL